MKKPATGAGVLQFSWLKTVLRTSPRAGDVRMVMRMVEGGAVGELVHEINSIADGFEAWVEGYGFKAGGGAMPFFFAIIVSNCCARIS